ncbi:MAG: hypothetical protein QOH57_1615 [Mycobacterium sp.]|jgi:hypothetical protein|nr:hypothetical protein [Mycobacterium sp.]
MSRGRDGAGARSVVAGSCDCVAAVGMTKGPRPARLCHPFVSGRRPPLPNTPSMPTDASSGAADGE